MTAQVARQQRLAYAQCRLNDLGVLDKIKNSVERGYCSIYTSTDTQQEKVDLLPLLGYRVELSEKQGNKYITIYWN